MDWQCECVASHTWMGPVVGIASVVVALPVAIIEPDGTTCERHRATRAPVRAHKHKLLHLHNMDPRTPSGIPLLEPLNCLETRS